MAILDTYYTDRGLYIAETMPEAAEGVAFEKASKCLRAVSALYIKRWLKFVKKRVWNLLRKLKGNTDISACKDMSVKTATHLPGESSVGDGGTDRTFFQHGAHQRMKSQGLRIWRKRSMQKSIAKDLQGRFMGSTVQGHDPSNGTIHSTRINRHFHCLLSRPIFTQVLRWSLLMSTASRMDEFSGPRKMLHGLCS